MSSDFAQAELTLEGMATPSKNGSRGGIKLDVSHVKHDPPKIKKPNVMK